MKNRPGFIGTCSRLSFLFFPLVSLHAATLTVGVGKMYAKPSLAITAAHDGDTINIDAGTYVNDSATITASHVTLQGVGGLAHLAWTSGTLPNGKAIWVTAGNNLVIKNIEFTGATVGGSGSSANGAGIRAEGAGLTILNGSFHDNQEGILAGDNSGSDIDIENSLFYNNGIMGGDGHTHNMYINHVRSFTLKYSYSYAANIGHEVKSRALKSVIAYNRLMDQTGSASYVIDIPDGGETYIIGNIIEQGSATQNSAILTYAVESTSNPVQQYYVVNNTIVNDYTGGTWINVAGKPTGKITNNLFVGPGTPLSTGAATLATKNLTTAAPAFVDRGNFDYRLTASSPAIDAGADPGSAVGGMSLAPTLQYVYDLARQNRTTTGAAIDAGAFEYSATLTFTQWEAQYFTSGQMNNAAVSGATATPQGDGIPNLLKYVYNINPARPMSAADYARLPGVVTTASALKLTFHKYALLTGVRVQVQTSSDLQNWSTLSDDNLARTGTDGGDAIMVAQVVITGSRSFVRLSVSST